MKVGINATLLPGSGHGGVETAVAYLVKALASLEDGDEEYVLVTDPRQPDWLEPFMGSNMKVVTTPAKRPQRGKPFGPLRPLARRMRAAYVRLTWNDPWLKAPRSNGFFESLGCDIVHFPFQHYVLCNVPTLFNPHDLQHVHFRRFFTPQNVAWRNATYRTAFRNARIVVGSRWVKEDIIRHYHVATEKIQVIPWAAPGDSDPLPSADVSSVLKKHGLVGRTFCLYPAMTWPHKNHVRLLEAIALLRDRDGIDVHVVCTGHKNDYWTTIAAKIDDLELAHQVTFLGLVSRHDLKCLYRACRFVVVPSLFEAASGPVFEAWVEGAAVACSTVTSLPEQVGDAALLFDPHTPEVIAAALKRMSLEDDLRKKLISAGRRRLGDFSWGRTARAYRAVYRQEAGMPLSEEEEELLRHDWMASPTVSTDTTKSEPTR